MKETEFVQVDGDINVAKWCGMFARIAKVDNHFYVVGVNIKSVYSSMSYTEWGSVDVYIVEYFEGPALVGAAWYKQGLRVCAATHTPCDMHNIQQRMLTVLKEYMWYAGGDTEYCTTLKASMERHGIPQKALWSPDEYEKLPSFETEDEETAWKRDMHVVRGVVLE